MKNSELKKTFVMSKPNVIEKCLGQAIDWVEGADPTIQKKRKGKGKSKEQVWVKADSFFNFFETVDANKELPKIEKQESVSAEASESQKGDMSASESQKEDKPEAPIVEEEELPDPNAEKMEADFDIGSAIRDDLVPNALQYYLGVVEDEDSDGWGDDDEEEGEADSQGNPKKEDCK